MNAERWIGASEVTEGTRIMWAGHRCTVICVRTPLREWYNQRVYVEFDLDVPGLPPRTGVRYLPGEPIQTWEPVGVPQGTGEVEG